LQCIYFLYCINSQAKQESYDCGLKRNVAFKNLAQCESKSIGDRWWEMREKRNMGIYEGTDTLILCKTKSKYLSKVYRTRN
jgi:hypothetical protein